MADSDLSKRIIKIRKAAGLTQDEFADKLGISQAHVSDMETGRRIPPKPLKTAICYKFAINEEWLDTGQGEKVEDGEEKYSFQGIVTELRNKLKSLDSKIKEQGAKLDDKQKIIVLLERENSRLREELALLKAADRPNTNLK